VCAALLLSPRKPNSSFLLLGCYKELRGAQDKKNDVLFLPLFSKNSFFSLSSFNEMKEGTPTSKNIVI